MSRFWIAVGIGLLIGVGLFGAVVALVATRPIPALFAYFGVVILFVVFIVTAVHLDAPKKNDPPSDTI